MVYEDGKLDSLIKGLRKLKQLSRSTNSYFTIYDDSCINEQYLSPEDKSRIAELLNKIYSSNLIFTPDEEFLHIPDDITPSELCAIASELSTIREKSVQRQSKENSVANYTLLQALPLNIRTWAILNNAGITTISQLQALSSDDLASIGLKPNKIIEIKQKLASFVYNNTTPEVLHEPSTELPTAPSAEPSSTPSTTLERLKLIKTLSAIEVEKLRKQADSAQTKLTSLGLEPDKKTDSRGE